MMILELVNVFYVFLFITFLSQKYKISIRVYFLLLFHMCFVFLTNDFLFPIDYMPDQWRYLESTIKIRENLEFIEYYKFDKIDRPSNVSNSSLFFSLFPIPFINSVYSIGLINYLMYSFIFFFLYKKNILKGNVIWFYLLFPSLALYSSLALRDTLILTFMILSVYFFNKNKMFLSILLSIPLIFIKFQNFIIFIFAILIYKNLDLSKINLKLIVKILIMVLIFFIGTSFILTLEQINHLRLAMYLEDGGSSIDFIPVTSYLDFFIKGLISAIYMILKPLPWEATSAVQLLQSFENIIVFFIILFIFKKQIKLKDKFINFLIIYFIIAMIIYGMIVFNFGTAARYRFTFEVVFIVFALYRINLYKYRAYKRKIK